MKKIIFISLIIICNSFSILALPDYPAKEDSTVQTKTVKKENLAFIELGGNGIGLSFNYERYINDNLSFRIGLGSDILLRSAFIPLLLNYSFKKPFELGFGMIVYNFTTPNNIGNFFGHSFGKNDSGILITSLVGFKNRIKWMVIKFSFTPLYNPENSEFLLYGGLSFGVTF